MSPRLCTKWIAMCVLLAGPSTALSQDGFVPHLFEVTGVASDDVLNVRSAPDAGSPIVDKIAPGSRGVEVIALNDAGTWGKVSAGEGNGWASLTYLTELPLPDEGIPPGMSCVGTEPFWSITFHVDTADFSDPTGAWSNLPMVAARSGLPWGSAAFGFDIETPTGQTNGIIDAAQCSDGMSDREFGWKVTVLRQQSHGAALEHGCCTLDQR